MKDISDHSIRIIQLICVLGERTRCERASLISPIKRFNERSNRSTCRCIKERPFDMPQHLISSREIRRKPLFPMNNGCLALIGPNWHHWPVNRGGTAACTKCAKIRYKKRVHFAGQVYVDSRTPIQRGSSTSRQVRLLPSARLPASSSSTWTWNLHPFQSVTPSSRQPVNSPSSQPVLPAFFASGKFFYPSKCTF